MIIADKEYDVYILIRHRRWWHWFFWWIKPGYQIVLGTSFESAEKAASAAEIRANAAGGFAIGIAADAIVCCREQHGTLGD